MSEYGGNEDFSDHKTVLFNALAGDDLIYYQGIL